MTGSWLLHFLNPSNEHRAVLQSLFKFARNHAWVSCVFSWGNTIMELVLPVGIMLFTECWQMQLAFHGMAILFHVSIFLLMGPNFSRYCLMHLLALNPLGYVKQFAKCDKQRRLSLAPPVQRQDWLRVIYAIAILLGWWQAQFRSDILHILGRAPWNHLINSFFPFPEMSMFAYPADSVSTNFGIGLLLTALSLLILMVTMVIR